MQQPIEVEDLRLDVVLLSHTHYDHLDIPSAKKIGNRALWLVLCAYHSIHKYLIVLFFRVFLLDMICNVISPELFSSYIGSFRWE